MVHSGWFTPVLAMSWWLIVVGLLRCHLCHGTWPKLLSCWGEWNMRKKVSTFFNYKLLGKYHHKMAIYFSICVLICLFIELSTSPLTLVYNRDVDFHMKMSWYSTITRQISKYLTSPYHQFIWYTFYEKIVCLICEHGNCQVNNLWPIVSIVTTLVTRVGSEEQCQWTRWSMSSVITIRRNIRYFCLKLNKIARRATSGVSESAILIWQIRYRIER